MADVNMFRLRIRGFLERLAKENGLNVELEGCIHFARELNAERLEYVFYGHFPMNLRDITSAEIDAAAKDAGFDGTTRYYRVP